MKILFVTRAYSPNGGGMERLSYELIENLKNNPDAEAEVIAQEQTDVKSKKAKRMVQSFAFMLASFPKSISAAKNADVVHLGDPLLAKLGWFIRILTKKPVVMMVHGLDITYSNPLYQLYLNMFLKSSADLFLPISAHADAVLKNKIPNAKSKIINPGVSDRYFDQNQTQDALNKIVGQDVSGKKVLFTLGRLVKRKGHIWFIENVLPKLPENCLYVIAGDGPERLAITVAAKKAKREVTVLGRVNEEELKTLYNTVDAFVQPNTTVPGDAEGFGLVLVEAALCQRPVFASNLEGMTDAIQDGKNGYLLEAENVEAWVVALQTKQNAPEGAREYSQQKFSWTKQAENYLSAFRTVV